ncbi:MAG: hypothetical protein LBC41_09765, partial [Clostridiales bacterium]|nr:hypothetical protein [Clostridiales bacterium]
MATIRVDTRKTRNFSSDFLELSKRVEKDAKTVSAATTKLDKTVKAKGKISADLESLRKSLEEIAKALQNASVFTTESAQELAKAETKSVQMAAAAAGIAAGTAASVSAAKSGASQPQQSSAQKSKADVPVSQTVVAETRNSAAAKIKEGVKAEINHVQELPQSGHTPIPIVDVPLGMRAPALATAEVNRDKPDIKIASHRETAAPQTGVTIGAHRLGSEDVAAEAGQKSDVVIGSHRETPIQNLKTDVVIGSHRETASTGSKPGITIGSHRETQGTAPKPGITIGSHRETSDSGAAEEKPKSDIKIGAHRETSEENPKSSTEEKPKSGITIGSHRVATDAKKPETIKDKINAKLSGLDASAKKYLEENKDNLIGKAKQSGAALGISTLGSGLGKGISYGAEKLGITGGSAAASADFEATGLEASTVHVDGDTTAIASAKLGEVKASANASATFDPAGGNINASANANFSATAAKAGASYKNSFASLSAEAMV